MKKRVAATLLWFYAGWYGGAMIATFIGLSPALGLIIGTAAAAIVGGDPRGIIWTRDVNAPAPASAASTAPETAQNPA